MTELLTSKEEYELGIKIQKMMKLKELKAVEDAIKGIKNKQFDKYIKKTKKELASDKKALSKVVASFGANSPDDELKIIKEGQEAVKIMADRNLGLVHSNARKYKSHYGTMEYEDLVQYGMIGLMTAIYKFDPTMKNKFSTVATWWIFQSMNRNTNNYSRSVRLPENKIIQYGNILEIQNRYENDNTISNVEIDEIIMDELKITSKTLNSIRKTMESPVSLNKVISTDSDKGKELIEFLDKADDAAAEELENTLVKKELLNILNDILSKLSEKERDILSSSFAMGLVSEPLTPAKVRTKYSLSRVKYNTVLNKTLDHVKKELESMGLTFADFV